MLNRIILAAAAVTGGALLYGAEPAAEKTAVPEEEAAVTVIRDKGLPARAEKTAPGENTPVKTGEAAKNPVKTASPEAAAAEKKAPPTPGAGDPFDYGAPGLDDYNRVGGRKPLNGVTVKGIIKVGADAPVAILQIEGNDRVVQVRKGNVIRVQGGKNNDGSIGEVYLKVQDIRDDEVEITRQERPDQVIIIR